MKQGNGSSYALGLSDKNVQNFEILSPAERNSKGAMKKQRRLDFFSNSNPPMEIDENLLFHVNR